MNWPQIAIQIAVLVATIATSVWALFKWGLSAKLDSLGVRMDSIQAETGRIHQRLNEIAAKGECNASGIHKLDLRLTKVETLIYKLPVTSADEEVA